MKFGFSRFWRSVVLFCLPTVIAFFMGVYFFTVDYPEMKRDEKVRYFERLERFADSLESLDEVEFVWKRGDGIIKGDKSWEIEFPSNTTWKNWNPIEGTKKKEMWGWRSTPKGVLVWKRSNGEDDNLVFAAFADFERNTSSNMILIGGIVIGLVLLFTTVVGVKYFFDYVKTRDDFMAATAHDLTTPLVAMRYIIGKNDAEASILCDRILRIVANIKDFMRLGGKRPQPKLEKVDVIKAYNEAYSLFKEDYRDLFSGEDIVVKYAQDLKEPIFVSGDETMIVQILWNLLGNDLKYAAPYGKVEVEISSSDKFVDISFIDEGQGMTKKEMRKAFDSYYRAKTVLVSGKGGFGIGLSTAKEFAEAMGGKIIVRPNKPKGCVFTLSLKRYNISMMQ